MVFHQGGLRVVSHQGFPPHVTGAVGCVTVRFVVTGMGEEEEGEQLREDGVDISADQLTTAAVSQLLSSPVTISMESPLNTAQPTINLGKSLHNTASFTVCLCLSPSDIAPFTVCLCMSPNVTAPFTIGQHLSPNDAAPFTVCLHLSPNNAAPFHQNNTAPVTLPHFTR